MYYFTVLYCIFGGFLVSRCAIRGLQCFKLFTFCTMFENVQFFSHLHFKIAKSAIMTQKIFFLKIIIMGIKNMQNFMLISNSLMLSEMPLTKVKKQKTTKKCTKTKKLKIPIVFWLQLFLGTFVQVGINEFEISIKFCVFLIPILIFFKKKIFWVIIALFAILKCKCGKNCTFSNILQKSKKLFSY